MAQTTFEIPKLTEANRLEEVSRFINGKTYHLIRLRPTVLNTLLRLLLTGMRAMGFAFMVMLVLYLPDYVFDYSTRGGDFLRFFFIYIGIMLAIVFAISLVFICLRQRTLYIDPEDKTITFSLLFTAKTLERRSIQFSDIVSIDKQITSNPLTPSLLTVIAREKEFVIAEICYGQKDIHLLYDWLMPFLSLPKV